MKHLIAILCITLSLIGFATLLWSWPGEAAWLALAPGIIVGSVLKHLVDAWLGYADFRFSFVVLGLFFGVFSSFVALLFMGAASAPSEVELTHTMRMDYTDSIVEEEVREPLQWANWSHWLGGIEGTDTAENFTTTLLIGGNHVPARHIFDDAQLDEDVLTWRVELPEGSGIADVEEQLTWRAEGDGVQVAYRLRYSLPSITGRALHALLFKGSLRAHVNQTLEGLASALEERNREL